MLIAHGFDTACGERAIDKHEIFGDHRRDQPNERKPHMADDASAALATGSGAPDVPDFGRVAYLAAGDSELALVKTKTGAFKMKVTDEVLVRVPRSDIASSELDQGKLLSK